jgi:hypothetical protein
MDAIRKNGEFVKLMRRLGAVALRPAGMLASCLLISSLLYAAVALTGRKPEYHTILSICVLSSFVILAGYVLQLGMMLAYRTTAVDTTMGMLGQPGKPTLWSAIDPFRIWFWGLIGLGMSVTQQLSRRGAIVSCCLLFLIATVLRVGLEFLPAKMGG